MRPLAYVPFLYTAQAAVRRTWLILSFYLGMQPLLYTAKTGFRRIYARSKLLFTYTTSFVHFVKELPAYLAHSKLLFTYTTL